MEGGEKEAWVCCLFFFTLRHTHHTDVAKLVCSSHGVIVQEGGSGDPAWVGVVGEDDQLVLVPLVAHPDEALLNV